MPTPDVTVVVACRDEVRGLGACIDALEAQDFPRSRTEILFVDGGSTDGSAELARSRGLRLLSDDGRGPAVARNVGIRAARGRFVAFTDADCVPRFDWLTRLLARFDDPRVHGVAGGLRMPRATLLGRFEDNGARSHYRGYITSNIAYRREVLLAVGGFDERLRCAEDHDLAWRVLEAGYTIVHAPDALVLHDPPEIHRGLLPYLRKQFWYARSDVNAHAQALRRRTLPGSALARAGMREAVGRSALLAGAVAGVALRSPFLVAGALGIAARSSAMHVARTIREVGEGELLPMAAIETARRLVRGAGTLSGIAGLARCAPASAASTTGGARASVDLPLAARWARA